ncbi:MAG: hypothetical protein MI700_14280 [Balneolales bacterium]|nr:hypothetical protein [Balneolales bacterium]
MVANIFKSFYNRLKRIFVISPTTAANELDVRAARRERIAVFVVAFIMALSLWFIVNLNGDYSTTINVPLRTGDVPDDMALVEGLPEFVQVDISGDGWKLVSLYNNPPVVNVDIVEGEVNLFEQVRQRFTVEQDVSVLKVQPFVVNIGLEEKIFKRIPILLSTDVSYMDRYGRVGEPSIFPDSITISGAASQVRDINVWEIEDTLRLSGVREDINYDIDLEPIHPLIEYELSEITYTENVSEFTEGEVSVYIRTRDLPRGSIINYTPSTVTIRFDIPIEQFASVQNERPYEVYVPYDEILEDSTGFVTPDIQLVRQDFEIRLRSFQPKAVAYFSVLDE